MRPFRTVCHLTAAALLVAAVGCGRDAEAGSAPAAGVGASAAPDSAAEPAAAATGSTVTAAPAAVPATATGSAPAAVPASVPAKPAPKLTALPAGPVAAGDLRDAYFHWKGATVLVAAHPVTFRDEFYWSAVNLFAAVAEKDPPELLDCDFANKPDGNVARSATVVLRGKLRARDFNTASAPPRLAMEDCEVVSVGEPPAETGDPWRLDGRPIPVQALYDAAFGWQGRTVQVVGRYDSSTHSSAGNVQRHDLADAAGKKAVACSHSGNAPAPKSAVDQRDGVIVEGTIGQPFFDTVNLENCRFVNRT